MNRFNWLSPGALHPATTATPEALPCFENQEGLPTTKQLACHLGMVPAYQIPIYSLLLSLIF
jgi:hypothetical protein